MGQKHVLITFNHAPYGSIFYNEGLRAVVGVTSGIDEHTVNVLYLGDGAYFLLRGVDRLDSQKYLSTLAKAGYQLLVEREALQERGIPESALAEDTQIISRQEAVDLIGRADVTIDF